MLPDLLDLDRYYNLAEYIFFRTSLLVLFVMGLYRLVRGDWRKKR
jgi:hypothetical protein